MGRRTKTILAIGAALLMAAGLGACTSGEDDAHPRADVSPAVNATTAPLLPVNALALPDFTPDRFGELLRQLHGTPVVVNVWGSWCGPCREEAPHLADAARRYGRRVQFLGVDLLDQRGDARAFITEHGWTYPSVFDPSPEGDIESDLGFFARPVTLFFDREGKRVDQISGPASAADLEAGIRRILR